MPAPEYSRPTNVLLPTLLPKLEGGLGFSEAFNSLAERLREYVNSRADKLRVTPVTNAEPAQPRLQFSAGTPRPPVSPRGMFGPVHTAHEIATTRERLRQELINARRPGAQ